MKRIIPEMHIKNCKEALEYYSEAFGGEIRNIQMADGKPMFKGYEGKVIHSELHINDACILYLLDVLEEGEEGDDIHLLLECDSEEEINRLYSNLSQKGTIHYELQKTFWGALHAVVIDCYGITWSLNYSSR